MSFRFHALSPEPFQFLFSLSDEALVSHKAVRYTATACPGAPCRVSLEDARVGESLILVQYAHLPVNSPYASSHAIFVREGVEQAQLRVGEVPKLMRERLLSVRAFSQDHMMMNADVVDGISLEECIVGMFSHSDVEYLHVHYAKPGCFAARVSRA
ncbi:DUF1203 domain-containing protein [Hirschia litorea]|uniref:DUF1203 domain-containing protein n=1 Tax=Hirschia litorea TaxID=1199156 RepID=A0ABW2IKU8_9PROT